MLGYWNFDGKSLLPIECPLPGFEDEWKAKNLGRAISSQGYQYQGDIVSHLAYENSKMYETTEEDKKYRYIIDVNPEFGTNFDLVFISSLPEYLLYLKFMKSIQGSELKDENDR